jgi:hypothetical protein
MLRGLVYWTCSTSTSKVQNYLRARYLYVLHLHTVSRRGRLCFDLLILIQYLHDSSRVTHGLYIYCLPQLCTNNHRVNFFSGLHSMFNVYTAVILVLLSVFRTFIDVAGIKTNHEMFWWNIHYHKANIKYKNKCTVINSVMNLISLEAAHSRNESITVSYSYSRRTRPETYGKPLVREGAQQRQQQNSDRINIWSQVPRWARRQDILTDWPLVVTWPQTSETYGKSSCSHRQMQVGISAAGPKLRIIQVVYLLCESIKVHNICSMSIICVVPHSIIIIDGFTAVCWASSVFQFLSPIQSRYDSLDGGSVQHSVSTYTRDITKEWTHIDINVLRGIGTHDITTLLLGPGVCSASNRNE